MKTSSCSTGLGVYDFKEEDELPEIQAGKYLRRFRNPSADDHAQLKYDFLECVARGSDTRKSDAPFVDVDDLDDDPSQKNCIMNASLGTGGDSAMFTLQCDSIGNGPHTYCSLDSQELRSSHTELEMGTSSTHASSPGESPSESASSESPLNDKSVDLNSDADENADEQAVTSDIEEDGSLNGLATNCHVDSMELVTADREIVFSAEYVVFRGSYYSEPLLSFSQACVRIDVSTAHGEESFECSIDYIVDISCQWFTKVNTVLVKLQVISKDAVQADSMHSSSDIEEMKFAAVDPNWSRIQDMIMGLNVKYSAIWTITTNTGMEEVEMSHQKCYFPNFDEPFEELIYPKGDCDAVSISKRDVDLLEPETFINDTIIDFYIKYLKKQIHRDDMKRFHFFNSFFFRKLADMDKDPSSASDGRAAFLRVRKWTRKINLFEKDYIFIPVNFNLHWSLIVICHPGEVASFSVEDLTKADKLPCILHMDSIRGSHTGLKNLVQSYLWEEWKEKGNDASEHMSSKFSNLRFVPLELPQQENSFDCGLFLLHYLELFLAEAPPTFNPFKISKFSRYLNADWFLPVEASLKRTVIQKLIYGLLDGQPQEASPAVCNNNPLSPEILETKVESRYSGDSHVGTANPNVSCHSVPEADKGIEIDLLGDPSVRNPHCASSESGLVLREFFEPASSGEPFLGHCQSFNEQSYYHIGNAVSAMEVEDEDIGAQFGYVPYGTLGETDFRGNDRNSQQAGEVPSADDGFVGQDHTWKSEISLVGKGEDNVETVDTSAHTAEDSEEIRVLENNGNKHEANSNENGSTSPNNELNRDEHQSPPLENQEEPKEGELAVPTSSADPPETVIIVDSQDLDDEMHGRGDPEPENLGSSQESLTEAPHRAAGSNGSETAEESKEEGPDAVRHEALEAPAAAVAISDHEEATGVMMEEVPDGVGKEMAEPTEEEPDAKRRRIHPPLGEEGSASEDIHL